MLLWCRGRFETCPYGVDDDDRRVNMVRHDDKSVEFHVRVMIRQPASDLSDDFAITGRIETVVNNFTERTFTLMGADRDKIRAV